MNNYHHIAVIVAGIDEEYQNSVIDGIIDCAKKENANVSCFAAFGGVIANSKYDIGEYNIYSLVNYHQFDGVVLLTNTIGDEGERAKILSAVRSSGIPAVMLDGEENDDFYNIRIDNSHAMREIMEHVIQKHQVKTVNFISGPLSNPEAQSRYETFLQVMAENRLIVDARRIYFGEFRNADGEAAAKQILSSKMKLPDAIICANDAMALGCMHVLLENGIRIPEDTIVTGFDDTWSARNSSPVLTTVSRPLYDAGYQACQVLLDVANGKQTEKNIIFNAAPVFTESCGCHFEEITDISKYKEKISKTIETSSHDINTLNRMNSELAYAETLEQNMQIIGEYLSELRCEKCYICLCEDWNNGATSSEYQVYGYTANMSAPVVWTKDGIASVERFPSSAMFPKPLKEGGHISYFLPLHFGERCLGYYIIVDSDFPTKSMLCHTLMMSISNSVENIRKLLHLNNVIYELDRLYVIDPLCGIYNRNGFIREADKMYHQCIETGETMMIAFIDMDGLKLINDNYGHKEGDFALQRLAFVIRDTCTANQICARFGGDEFVIVGSACSESEAETLERTFAKRLSEINEIIHKPYQLDASIGTYVTEVKSEVTLFNMITAADQIMYEKKKRKKTSRYLRKA